MKKVVFILPGYFDSTKELGYQEIGKCFLTLGYKIVFVEIVWKYKRVQDYLKQLTDLYQKEKGEENIILGFSFGALVSYLSAPLLLPDKLYLCSIAPYFKEDLDYIPEEDKVAIGKKRLGDIEYLSFDDIADQIICPVTIFYGENEQMFVRRRVQLAKEKIKNCKTIEVPNAGHDISNIDYIEGVKKEICSGFTS